MQFLSTMGAECIMNDCRLVVFHCSVTVTALGLRLNSTGVWARSIISFVEIVTKADVY